MPGKNTAVFGIYTTHESIVNVVEALRTAGFRNEDISILYSENVGSKDLATEKATKAPEGASAGAGAGAVIGGALGVLVGIGMLTIPGLGPIIAAGPIMAGLAGMGAGGAIGGIAGALIGLGIPEYEAKRYEGRVREGGILLSVHCDGQEWTKRAKEILERTGGQDISSTGEAAADYAASDKPIARSVTGGPIQFVGLGRGGNMIKKVKEGYKVLSEKSGKNLGGPYKTKAEAKKRLQQVEYFKRTKN